MPRINLPHIEITRAGVAPGAEVVGVPASDHELVNDGRVVLLVRNAHATVAQAVTINFATIVDGQPVTPRVVSVPPVSSRYIGPFPRHEYGDLVSIDISSADLRFTAYHLS